MAKHPTEFVLWGFKRAYAPVWIKIAGGTRRYCNGRRRERGKEGGWDLVVLAAGLSPTID